MVYAIFRHGVVRGTTVASRRSATRLRRLMSDGRSPSTSTHHSSPSPPSTNHDTTITSGVVSAVPYSEKPTHTGEAEADAEPRKRAEPNNNAGATGHTPSAQETQKVKSPEELYVDEWYANEALHLSCRSKDTGMSSLPHTRQPRGRGKGAEIKDNREAVHSSMDSAPSSSSQEHKSPPPHQQLQLHSLDLPGPYVARVQSLAICEVMLPRQIDYVLDEQHLQRLINRCRLSGVIYLDAEGELLSRHGTIDVLTIWAENLDAIHVVPVHTFGDKVFSMRSNGQLGLAQKHASLREMFRDEKVCKVAWDVRGDANALYWHYNVRFENMLDLQLLEAATRSSPQSQSQKPAKSSTGLFGLDRAVREHTSLNNSLKGRFSQLKRAARARFDPAAGGYPDSFRRGFITRQLLEYAGTDVRFLRLLELTYRSRPRCTAKVASIVRDATARRVRSALLADFGPGKGTIQGKHPAANPFLKGYDPHFWQHGSRLEQMINSARTSVLHAVAWWKWRARALFQTFSK